MIEVWRSLRTARGTTTLFWVLFAVSTLWFFAGDEIELASIDSDVSLYFAAAAMGLGAAIFWFLPKEDSSGVWEWREIGMMIMASLAFGYTVSDLVGTFWNRKDPTIHVLPITDQWMEQRTRGRRWPKTTVNVSVVQSVTPTTPHRFFSFDNRELSRGQCVRAKIRYGIFGNSWIEWMSPISCESFRGTAPTKQAGSIAWVNDFDNWYWKVQAYSSEEAFREWKDTLLGELFTLPPPETPYQVIPSVTVSKDGTITAVAFPVGNRRADIDQAVVNSLIGRSNLLSADAITEARARGELVLPEMSFSGTTLHFPESW